MPAIAPPLKPEEPVLELVLGVTVVWAFPAAADVADVAEEPEVWVAPVLLVMLGTT